jgi:uncharacterized protein (DUF2344 family)
MKQVKKTVEKSQKVLVKSAPCKKSTKKTNKKRTIQNLSTADEYKITGIFNHIVSAGIPYAIKNSL